ncbi:MAG: glycosyltransferase N-terminal domain-containing protein [Bacteroidia bacterium]|jgi:3-deoxy-D-manno-octulosonic-acid transferase
MRLIYSFSIHLYTLAIHVASLFSPKAKLWINGRKNIFQQLEYAFQNRSNIKKLIWVHCASLGEFEQGRPLMEQIKRENQENKILLTFFSPSGYEVRKNYSGADFIFYLPADTASNAARFISVVKPSKVLFVKYEFWFNYLNELKNQKVPTYLVCGIFRPDQHFFKNYGFWFRKHLNAFMHFYLQNEASESLLKSIGYQNATVAGDTRFDRVIEITKTAKDIPLINQFIGAKSVIVAGSTWQPDIERISHIPFQDAEYKLIIAPHEISETSIRTTISLFEKSSSDLNIMRYSVATEKTVAAANILIIDNIGMLSSLYQYGTIAYIGGGFGKGIHNILEPATFGLPVIFGPNYDKFNEAKELIKAGGAFSIASAAELQKLLGFLNKDTLKAASFASKNYVASNAGATLRIMNAIKS